MAILCRQPCVRRPHIWSIFRSHRILPTLHQLAALVERIAPPLRSLGRVCDGAGKRSASTTSRLVLPGRLVFRAPEPRPANLGRSIGERTGDPLPGRDNTSARGFKVRHSHRARQRPAFITP